MFLTNALLQKAKSKVVMVALRSTGSNHKIISFRERNADKKEIIRFDPHIRMKCVYKEEKKIRSMKYPIKIHAELGKESYGIIPKELQDSDSTVKKIK